MRRLDLHMKIILAPPFSRASLNSTALAPQQAAALHLEFLAINSVFERHRRRLNRAAAVGETLDMSFDRACAARDVRMYHARPFPVDEALVGIHDVLLFADVAASTLIDPAAAAFFAASWAAAAFALSSRASCRLRASGLAQTARS